MAVWLPVAAAVAVVLATGFAPRVGAERHVTAGTHHRCVLTPSIAVACVGDDFYKSSIFGTVVNSQFVAVTAGDTFTCALYPSGAVICWGAFPGTQPSISFIDIHAGAYNLCGLESSGVVSCYGKASAGVNTVPAGVYQGVSTGSDVACAVGRDHTIVCWGDATNPVVSTLPVITDADHVSVGARHACYITTAGGVACWGDNTAGQATVPAGINLDLATWWLSAGGKTTCAISGADALNMAPPGRLECWGEYTGTLDDTLAYEVACATWGCIVSKDAGGGAAVVSYAVTSTTAIPTPCVYDVTVLAGGNGAADGVGTNAQFYNPTGLALRDDLLMVTDTANKLIRRVNVTTADVTTFAGQLNVDGNVDSADPHSATFSGSTGLEYDEDGNLYVIDKGTSVIRMISAAGAVTTVAGQAGVTTPATDGVGTNVIMVKPTDIRYDSTNDIMYFTDDKTVRALYANMSVSTIAAGFNYSASALALDIPQRVIYVGTAGNILKITYSGAISTFSGPKSGIAMVFLDGIAKTATHGTIGGIVLLPGGGLYVTDQSYTCIRRVSPTGDVVTVGGSTTVGNSDEIGTAATFAKPIGIRLDSTGSTMFVAEYSNDWIRRVAIECTEVTALPAPLALAVGIAPDPPLPIPGSGQIMAWRAVVAVGNFQPLVFNTPPLLTANHTAGINPAIRALVLGTVSLPERPSAALADDLTFSTSARRGLHSLSVVVDALPPYALALPHLETLNVDCEGAMAISAHAFAGLSALSCINCGASLGVANLTRLGVRSSLTPGDLSLLSASGLFNISGITALDLTANELTAIGEHDFDGAVHLTRLYIGGNPDLTSIHCAAFTPEQQPLLTVSNIDDTGNPASTWRAGCVTPTTTPSMPPTPSLTPTPSGTETPSATLTGTGTPSYTPSPSATPTHTPSPSATPTRTPSPSATPSHTPSSSGTPSGTPSGTTSPSISPSTAVALASPGLSKADLFATALSLGLLSVAFIATLIVFRKSTACNRCCRAGSASTTAAAAPGNAAAATKAAPFKGDERGVVV